MYRRQDSYYRKARREGFAARSAYKLQEILRAHPLLRRGDRVIDLGAAPGSWMQVLAEVVGPEGRVVGIDLEPLKIALPACARFIRGDFREADVEREAARLLQGAPRAVVCDVAPKLTGVAATDRARVEELARSALETALQLLPADGSFLLKLFEGTDVAPLLGSLKARFREVRWIRPKATRKSSSEVYLLALGRAS